MLTVDCADVTSIQNELVVYVADKVEAIPTLKNHQFTLSTLDDEIIDVELVISAIKEYFDFINEGSNFAVISNKEIIHIKSVTGKVLQRESEPQQSQLSHSNYWVGRVEYPLADYNVPTTRRSDELP